MRLPHKIDHHAHDPQHHGEEGFGGEKGATERGEKIGGGECAESRCRKPVRLIEQVGFGAVPEDAGDLTAEEGGGKEEQGDQKDDEQTHTACGAAVSGETCLYEDTEQIVAEVHHHRRDDGTGHVHHDGEQEAGEQIDGKRRQVEVQESKEEGADEGGVENAAGF